MMTDSECNDYPEYGPDLALHGNAFGKAVRCNPLRRVANGGPVFPTTTNQKKQPL